jgi:ankyrin repeat protein
MTDTISLLRRLKDFSTLIYASIHFSNTDKEEIRRVIKTMQWLLSNIDTLEQMPPVFFCPEGDDSLYCWVHLEQIQKGHKALTFISVITDFLDATEFYSASFANPANDRLWAAKLNHLLNNTEACFEARLRELVDALKNRNANPTVDLLMETIAKQSQEAFGQKRSGHFHRVFILINNYWQDPFVNVDAKEGNGVVDEKHFQIFYEYLVSTLALELTPLEESGFIEAYNKFENLTLRTRFLQYAFSVSDFSKVLLSKFQVKSALLNLLSQDPNSIYVATTECRYELVQAFIKHGSNYWDKSAVGSFPIEIADENCRRFPNEPKYKNIRDLLFSQYIEAMKLSVSYQPTCEQLLFGLLNSPSSSSEEVSILIRTNLRRATFKGRGRLLHAAALNNNVDIASLLIEAGADITVTAPIPGIPDTHAITAAAYKNKWDMVRFLLPNYIKAGYSLSKTYLYALSAEEHALVNRLLSEQAVNFSIGWDTTLPTGKYKHYAAAHFAIRDRRNDILTSCLNAGGAHYQLSLLKIALQFNNFPAIKQLLLEYRAKPTAIDFKELRKAATKGYWDSVMLFLQCIDDQIRPACHISGLIKLALEQGKEQIYVVLLAYYFNALNHATDSVLDDLIYRLLSIPLPEPKQKQLLEKFTQTSRKIQAPYRLNRLLHRAAYSENETAVDNLHKAGAIFSDINEQNQGGISTLHLVARQGNTNILTSLLARGNVNINKKNQKDKTPLGIAAHYGHIEIARVLLSKGADINLKSNGSTALCLSVTHGHTPIVALLLQYPDIFMDLNIPGDPDRTGLHKAAAKGDTEIIKLLLAHGGVNVNLVDIQGHTALHGAMQNGHIDTIKVLLQCPTLNLDNSSLGNVFIYMKNNGNSGYMKKCLYMHLDQYHQEYRKKISRPAFFCSHDDALKQLAATESLFSYMQSTNSNGKEDLKKHQRALSKGRLKNIRDLYDLLTERVAMQSQQNLSNDRQDHLSFP